MKLVSDILDFDTATVRIVLIVLILLVLRTELAGSVSFHRRNASLRKINKNNSVFSGITEAARKFQYETMVCGKNECHA